VAACAADGVFAGAESRGFPGVRRRCGIPGLVFVDQQGSELQLLDVDGGTPGNSLIMSKGGAVFDDWKGFAWAA
jgi:hypothetical protein